MLKLNSWKSDLKTRCFMMFLFSIVFVCLRYNPSISKPYNTHQYTSIHFVVVQYTSTCSTIFWVSVVASAARGPPRRQRHPRGGPARSPRGIRHILRTVPGAAAATDGDGWTALHVAAAGDGHAEICPVLLAAGAEVDARDDRGLSAQGAKKFENAWQFC